MHCSGGGRVGTGAWVPAPLTEPDLWATHPALQVDISHGHRPGPRLDHWAPRPVVTLTFAIRSRMTLSSGTHELPALPLPCGLSANTTVSWHGRTLFNLSPPSLGRRYQAPSLLWGDPTSPRASVARRCLRAAYRRRLATDSWRSPGVRVSNVPRSPPPLLAWPRSDIGLRVGRHTCPGQASLHRGSLAFGTTVRLGLPSHTASRQR